MKTQTHYVLKYIAQNLKEVFVSSIYRSPARKYKKFETHFKHFLNLIKTNTTYIVEDLNLNLLDHRST